MGGNRVSARVYVTAAAACCAVLVACRDVRVCGGFIDHALHIMSGGRKQATTYQERREATWAEPWERRSSVLCWTDQMPLTLHGILQDVAKQGDTSNSLSLSGRRVLSFPFLLKKSIYIGMVVLYSADAGHIVV